MSNTEDKPLSPYHQALRGDLVDFEIMRHGIDAFARISGCDAETALNILAAGVTPEQREQVVKRSERAEEFYKLPADLQARLRVTE